MVGLGTLRIPSLNMIPGTKREPSCPEIWAKKNPRDPRSPKKPEYLKALATYLEVRWDSVPFNFWWTSGFSRVNLAGQFEGLVANIGKLGEAHVASCFFLRLAVSRCICPSNTLLCMSKLACNLNKSLFQHKVSMYLSVYMLVFFSTPYLPYIIVYISLMFMFFFYVSKYICITWNIFQPQTLNGAGLFTKKSG